MVLAEEVYKGISRGHKEESCVVIQLEECASLVFTWNTVKYFSVGPFSFQISAQHRFILSTFLRRNDLLNHLNLSHKTVPMPHLSSLPHL